MATTETRRRKASKRYNADRDKVERSAVMHPLAAMQQINEFSSAKFDEAVEAHFNLGLDVRKADQMLRGTVSLPHGTGKTMTIAVFAQGEKASDAEAAGADFVGGDDLAAKVQEGWTDFDVCIATPDMMGTVGKIGRILGPRGKMPNPKTGTVTFDVGKAVADAKKGKIEYRTDRYGIVHVIIGRKSFEPVQLAENYGAVMDEIMRAKPSTAKGRYIQSISVSATMSPGVAIDSTIVRDFAEEPAGA